MPCLCAGRALIRNGRGHASPACRGKRRHRMRSKIALLIAIACFAGVVFMGASFAGAQVAGVNVPEVAQLRRRRRRRRRRHHQPARPRLRIHPRRRLRSPSRCRSRFRFPSPSPPRPRPDAGSGDDIDGGDSGGGGESERRRRGRTAATRAATPAIGEQGPGGVSGNAGIDGATGENDEHQPRRPRTTASIGGNEEIEPPPPFTPDGAPTITNPTTTIAPFGPAPDRRPELRHRLLRDPALPAADLPGLRNPVRDRLADPRVDQQDRDRVRHQPQRLLRRRRRLDAVHALDLGGLRRRRQRRRAQGPLQPGRRNLRRGPLPQGGRRHG